MRWTVISTLVMSDRRGLPPSWALTRIWKTKVEIGEKKDREGEIEREERQESERDKQRDNNRR